MFILATAGHVDHGKSSIVKALTGTDPDRLPEEQARGLTIELGFAHLDVADEERGVLYRLGIVDVPGHEDFVHNMVAGVGSIDLALLTVAADDGWMPQTEEHLEILTYLGIERGVVALSKCDLLPDGNTESVRKAIRKRLEDSPLAEAPIVSTAAPSGLGIDDLVDALRNELRAAPPPADLGKPRLSVDRVFSIGGAGTIVTGTLSGGRFTVGQRLIVQAGGRATRLRTIQSYHHETDEALPGARTALNLPDLEADADVRKGDVVTLPALGDPTSTIDVHLEMALRILDMEKAHVRPLKHQTRVRFHHGSADVPGTVMLLDCDELLPGESALAQIRLESPAFVFTGDRFILRDWQERLTMAGGTILDPHAERVRLRSAARTEHLGHCRAAGAGADSWVEAVTNRWGAVPRSDLLVQSPFSEEEIHAAVLHHVESGTLVDLPSWSVSAVRWTAWKTHVASQVDAFHTAHPERGGLPVTELRDALRKISCPDDLMDPFFAALDGFSRTGTIIHRAGHVAVLPENLRGAAARLRSDLSSADPPAPRQMVNEADARQAMQFLLESGEAVQISSDLILSQTVYQDLLQRIQEFIASQGTATVSELRQALQSTRRVVVPLLEKLDSEGVTIRDGDKRKLRGAT